MPIYEYKHTNEKSELCDDVFEEFEKMSDEPLKECPVCGHKVQRILSLFTGVADKMGPARLKELGFTRLHRRDKGVYEKE